MNRNQNNRTADFSSELLNIIVNQFDDFSMNIVFKQDNQPLDLTQYTFVSEIRDKFNGSLYKTITCTLGPNQGELILTLDTLDNQLVGEWLYDLKMVDLSSRKTVIQGKFIVKPVVTL